MKIKCAILDDHQNVAMSMADWSILGNKVQIDTFQTKFSSEENLVDALREYEIIVAMRERTAFKRSTFAELPNLNLLVTTGMRNSSIDMVAAGEHKVMVAGTRSLSEPAAELTWGLILALARSIPQECASLRSNGPWQSTLGVGLAGKTLGVIGLGKIGSDVARVAKAFYMNVIAWSTNLTKEQTDQHEVDLASSKEELLAKADFVTIHVVLSGRSTNLIGAAELTLMKPSAYLINTSRAAIVNQQALAEALLAGTIAGAAMDVFDEEPLPADHVFRRLSNVIATPHLGYVTKENYQVYFEEVLENIKAFIRGEPIRVLN